MTNISATEFDIAASQVETVDLTGTGFLPGGTYCMSEGLSEFGTAARDGSVGGGGGAMVLSGDTKKQ